MSIRDLNVGDALEPQKNPVGKYQPIYYGGASGDFNPIHIDPEFGKMAGLGGNILQGLCTMAFVVKAVVDQSGGDPASLRRIKVRFAKPVMPNDTVMVDGKVAEKTADSAVLELQATTKKGEVQVITHASATVKL
jgi:3-hydroxybutyryl-CoA dehydratase